MIIVYAGLHISIRCSCQILVKLEFSQKSFEKFYNIKFNENPSSWNRVVPFGQTDKQTDTTS
jgi:hypothetical protein